jgi:hypothetical protein
MLTAERDSANPNGFALVAMLGLLGLRIFEATGADIAALGEARLTACSRCTARAKGPHSSHSRPR